MPSEAQTARTEQALRHLDLGFGVFPVYPTYRNGVCRCAKGAACDSPGKHPLSTLPKGFHSASWDAQSVRTFMANALEPNYGLVWPETHRVVVAIDVDGEGWNARLGDLTAQFGQLPPTKVTRTPSGGLHLFYDWPEGYDLPEKANFHGFLMRAPMKGYVVGPGSAINGSIYLDERPDNPIATLPKEWVSTLGGKKPLIEVGRGQDWVWDGVSSRHDLIRDFIRRARGVTTSPTQMPGLIDGFMQAHGIPRQHPNGGRPISEEEITRMIDGAYEKYGEDGPTATPEQVRQEQQRRRSDELGAYVGRAFSTYAPREMKWLWGGWLPRGVVTLLDGNPGVGKSNVVIDLIARATVSGFWPDGTRTGVEDFKALYITREDDPATTLVPRLIAAGGDASKAMFLDAEMMLPQDAPRLSALIENVKPDLVVIDPIFSHVGVNVKTISDNDVRVNVMNPLMDIAASADCVMLVLRHFNKQVGSSALNRGAGSLGGFVGAARHVLSVVNDPDGDDQDPTRIIGVIKSNYARTGLGLKYRIEGVPLPGWTTTVSRIAWQGASVVSVDDILLDANPGASRGAGEALIEVMVQNKYRCFPQDAITQMKSRGFGKAATYTAAKRIGVQFRREGFPSKTVWLLDPLIDPSAPVEAEEEQEDEVVTPLRVIREDVIDTCIDPVGHPQEMTPSGLWSCRRCLPSDF